MMQLTMAISGLASKRLFFGLYGVLQVQRAHLSFHLVFWALLLVTASSFGGSSKLGTAAESITAAAQRSTKRYLVVVPTGDASFVSRWMDGFEKSNWDIILLHFGDKPLSCPACLVIIQDKGSKWQLLRRLMDGKAWAKISKQYEAVMYPDDDLVLDVATINIAFDVFALYKLKLGQPSLCRDANTATVLTHLVQQESKILRFTSHVEVMAPMFSMHFLNTTVRDTLPGAFFAWGLGFVWPYLLGYPRDHVGVIDLVCMGHPERPPRALAKRKRIYKLGPEAAGHPYKGPGGEKQYLMKKHGLNSTVAKSMGLPRLITVFSSVKLALAAQVFNGTASLKDWDKHRQPEDLATLMAPG